MNYNDLQQMKPYYNTMNYRYNDNIPKALPIIRNSRFDHGNVTVAPPIPSYYKQNINATNYYSHLPNIMNVTYSSAEQIAKNFSNNLNNLRNLESQIAEGNRVHNLPKLNQTQNDINYKNMLKSRAKEKMENGTDDEDIKNKINLMREEAGRIPDYKTEEQKKIIENKEIMSEEGINAFNKNLISQLADYSNNIQKTILAKNSTDDAMYEMIKHGISSLKEDFSKRIESFNKQSKTNMETMRKIMQSSTNPRLKLLSENLFSTSDIDQMLKMREKKRKKDGSLIDNRRMSQLMLNALEDAKNENEKNKQNELNKEITEEKDDKKKKNLVVNDGEEIEKIPLDLWEKKRARAVKGDEAIDNKVNLFGKNYFELQPLNRFRSYVFSVMAARRILNIKYYVFKEFKFTSVSYYISNFEDMDIILKKLVYNTVKEPLLEILNNTDMNINLTYDTEDNHETYFLLQDYLQRIINNFNIRFFAGMSGEMMKYLSLYITNYSFIPKDFFTTFELVRIRTSETGEFIELNDENRKMILTFYMFIKILLRNIFLELMFNQADRKKLSLNPKLNIKMVVSVLYRSIIRFLVKNCVTRTNLEDLENAEDMTAFLKIKYGKREFHLHRFLKKRYFLKVSDVDEKPKRISKRSKQLISPKESEEDEEERKIRETKKRMDEKNKKKLEKIEEENKSNDKKSSDKSSSKKRSDKKSSKKSEKEGEKKEKEGKKEKKEKESGSESDEDEEEEEESDSEDEKKSKDKKDNKNKKSGSEESDEKSESKTNDKKSNKKEKDKNKNKKEDEDEDDEESDDSSDDSDDSSGTNKKKKKGRAPPGSSKEESSESDDEDDEDEEDEEDEEDSEEESKKDKKQKKGILKKKTQPDKSESNKTKSDKTKSKKTSTDKSKKSKKSKKTKASKKSESKQTDKTKSKKSSKKSSKKHSKEEEEDEEEEEEEEEEISNDNYKEEREKLMPKRKISTEKLNGKVKQRLMGEEPKLKIAIRGKDPLKGKDTIKDFSKSDIDNMYFIIENFQSYGDDLDSNEVDLLDRVLYTNKSLDKYYLYANEYAFDPSEMIDKIMSKLLEKIQINFSRLDD